MVAIRFWLFAVSLLVVTASVPLTTVQADVEIEVPAAADDVIDGIQNVNITSPGPSTHVGGTEETVSWTTEPAVLFNTIYEFKIELVRVSDGTSVDSETKSCGGFGFHGTTCSHTFELPIERGFFDINVKSIDDEGNERCDFQDGLFKPCDSVRIFVKIFDFDINVYEVCTRDTLDLHCKSHVAYDPDDRTVEVPADEEAVVSIHAAGLTKPNSGDLAFDGFTGHVNVTGKLRCMDGQPCVDLGGGISRATHQVWADGHPADGGSFPDVGTKFTVQARDFFVEGPALDECHDLDIHVFVETDTHARTDDGTLTLCSV